MKKIIATTVLLLLSITVFAKEDVIKVRDLYNKDLTYSQFAIEHVGKEISIYGFMAPPLKAESIFFVLTKRPLAVCPFCESDADWPSDIVAIYAKKNIEVLPYNVPIIVTGKLQIGSYTDQELGFVSQIRLVDSSFKRK